MKKYLLLVILVSSLLITACEEHNTLSDEGMYVPGQVLIGINSDVSMESVFDLMNEKGVHIESMSGFFNYSTFPNDSLSFVENYLADKPYLVSGSIGRGQAAISATEHKIVVTEFFYNMDLAAQQDWLETMEVLKLDALGGESYKSITIKVESGTEKDWVNKFKDHPYVQWAERNQYADIWH